MRLRRFIRLFKTEASLPVPTKRFVLDPSMVPIPGTRAPRPLWFLRIALSAAFLFLTVGSAAFAQAVATPVATVSVDFNPGIVYEINRFGRVVGMNEIASTSSAWTEEIDYRNRLIEDVVQATYAAAVEEGLVQPSAVQYFLIGVDSGSASAELAVVERIRNANAASSLQLYFLTEHNNNQDAWYGLGSATLSPAFSDQPATEDAAAEDRGPIDSIYDIVTPYELLSTAEYVSLASELQISEAKLALIVQILVRQNQTANPAFLIQLANTDINQLILIYLR